MVCGGRWQEVTEFLVIPEALARYSRGENHCRAGAGVTRSMESCFFVFGFLFLTSHFLSMPKVGETA